MKRKFFSLMLATAALTVGFTSCNNEDDVLDNTESLVIKNGDPTSMQFTVTMPRAPKTYGSTDNNATDAEIELKTVNVLIYAEATNGSFGLEKNGNKSLTMADFEEVSGTPDTYKLKDASKLPTTTGKKKIFVAMNYPGTLPTSEGAALSELEGLEYSLLAADALSANGIAMFSTEPTVTTLVKEGDAGYETANSQKITVKRLVAKVTVQEKLARTGGKIMIDGGELTALKFDLGHQNKEIYAMQKLVGTTVQDPNWETYDVANFFPVSSYAPDAANYREVDAEATAVLSLKTAYVPENTAKLFTTNGENATYISVRGQYAPAFFVDGAGVKKGDNTEFKTFYTVVKGDGTVLYFDVEADATTYATANSLTVSAPYTDGLCYYRAYLNNNAKPDAGTIIANKNDVLRNNYYKAMIKSIKVPGAPTDEGDIIDPTTIDVDVDIDPWTPIEWKIRSKLTPIRQLKVIPFANGN